MAILPFYEGDLRVIELEQEQRRIIDAKMEEVKKKLHLQEPVRRPNGTYVSRDEKLDDADSDTQ